MKRPHDVIVIGGGFAGVAAARELGNLGLRSALVEARDRLGGRTWTSAFENQLLELGGMSAHWLQPFVWSDILRYGIRMTERTPRDAYVFVTENGDIERSPQDGWLHVRELYEQLFSGVEAAIPRPFDPFFAHESVASLDVLSLQDRLDDIALPPDDAKWLSGHLQDFAGGDLGSGAYLQLARWFALSGWNVDRFNDTQERYRFADGTVSLIEAMVADSQADVHLSAPVSDVVQTDDGVTVVMRSGRELTAKGVVVALPTNVWSTVTFSPGLTGAHAAVASVGFGSRNFTKIWVKLRGSVAGFTIFCPAGAPVGLVRSEGETDDGRMAVAFSCRPTFGEPETAYLVDLLGRVSPGVQVFPVVTHEWGADEYARSGHAFPPPGATTSWLREAQLPVGRTVFATSDIASGWNGFIDGAIESGVTAARRIAAVVSR